jgi:hypothetical protein
VDAVVKMYDRARLTTRSGDEPAEAAERLRERADPERIDAVEVGIGAEHRVRVVEHEQRAVARAHLGQCLDRRDVAVHGEHGVADHDGPPSGSLGEEVAHVLGIGVAVHRDLGARHPAPVDDRGVVERVGAHEHVGPAERGEHPEVRGEAGGEEHRGLGAAPVG